MHSRQSTSGRGPKHDMFASGGKNGLLGTLVMQVKKPEETKYSWGS